MRFDSRQVQYFSFATASRPPLGPKLPSVQWIPGVLSPGVKRSKREADHSPPSSAEASFIWSFTLMPLCSSVGWRLDTGNGISETECYKTSL
jgi:hypothetical protein